MPVWLTWKIGAYALGGLILGGSVLINLQQWKINAEQKAVTEALEKSRQSEAEQHKAEVETYKSIITEQQLALTEAQKRRNTITERVIERHIAAEPIRNEIETKPRNTAIDDSLDLAAEISVLAEQRRAKRGDGRGVAPDK